jgi:enoyl-CoA hydratase/carnithine racemase
VKDVPAASTVTVDTPAPGVRRFRIGNERHRGALSIEVLGGLEDALAQVPQDIRCLLLTGTGATFSAVYDLAALSDPPDPEHANRTIAPEQVGVLSLLERQSLPVVAAVNGPALGGGLELVLACDIRIAVPSASLGAPAGRLGLVYSPDGLERVMREIPFGIAAELFLSGATLDAERAHHLGLFSQIVAPQELDRVALEVASNVVALSAVSVRANRMVLHAIRRAGSAMPAEDRQHLRQARQSAMRSADFAEGLAAFRQHRDPRFSRALLERNRL